MKDYYQQKKTGFKLQQAIYRKTVNQIRCFRDFEEIVRKVENKSETEIKTKDIDNKTVAERYINAVKEGINFIPVEYRQAVWEHMVEGEEYMHLEEKYFLSTSAMREKTQAFVFGVARALGEDFLE